MVAKRIRLIAIGACVVAASMGAAGCGAAAHVRTPTASTRTLTTTQFRAQANDVCRFVNESLIDAVRASLPAPDLYREVVGHGVNAARELTALSPPARFKTDYAAFVRILVVRNHVMRRVLARIKAGVAPPTAMVRRRNAETYRANRLARRFGLGDCPFL